MFEATCHAAEIDDGLDRLAVLLRLPHPFRDQLLRDAAQLPHVDGEPGDHR